MTPSGQHLVCERCGARIPQRGRDRLCPACLLESLLEAPPPLDLNPESTSTEAVPLLKTFGDYELIERVGVGGMAVVYRARHRRLQRTVALKLIRHHGSTTDQRSFTERFQLEARAAAALDHPDIVSVFEHGEVDGQGYIAMRYVEGESLDRLVSRKRPTLKQGVEWVCRVAHAVHYAHQRGVLHRDLKPGNVLIDKASHPHLADFGLARFMEGSEALTRTTVSMGTPAYMSPEVARGETTAVTTAADVYGLGTILYEILAGHPPFSGERPYEVLRKVIEEDPIRPSQCAADVPTDLDTICLKALSKQPSQRYGSALELAQDLQRWLNNEPILAHPPTRWERLQKWCVREPFQAAIAGLMVLGTALFIVERTASNERLKQERDISRREQLRAEKVSTRLLLEEADRRLVHDSALDALALFAHVLRESPSNDVAATRIVSLLQHRDFALPLAIPVQNSSGPISVQFLPSGHSIMLGERNGRIRICDAKTGETQGHELVVPAPCLETRISRDGKTMVAGCGDGSIHLWEVAGMKPIRLLQMERGGALGVDLSHDGQRVAASGDGNLVQIWDVNTGQLLRKERQDGLINRVRFHPDGQAVASASTDGTVMLIDWRQPLSQVRKRRMTSEQTALDWHPTGQFLATQEAGYERISLLDPDSLETRVGPMPHGGILRDIAFNRDGSRILGASEDHLVRIWDPATGHPLSEPLPHPDVVLSADFSPDGRRVVTACQDGAVRVWDVRPGQASGLQLPHPKPLQHIEVSPDGRAMATLALDWKLRVFDALTGKLRFPAIEHPDPLQAVYFSADSTKLVVMDGARVSSNLQVREGHSVRVYDTQSGNLLTTVLDLGTRPASIQFSKNGQRLLVGDREGRVSLWDISGSQSKLALEIVSREASHGEPISSVRFSPDETRVVAAFVNGVANIWSITNSSHLDMHLRRTRGLRWAEFNPQGTHVLTCSDDHKAYLWKLAQPEMPSLTFSHDQIVHGAHFDAKGDRVVTFSIDNTARVWDVRTGQLLVPALNHQQQVWSAFFSEDDRRIITATWQGSVRVWDAATGLPLTESLGGNIPQRPYVEQPDRARLTPDGRRVACAFADQTVRLVDLPKFSEPPPAWLVDLAEGVAGRTFESRPGKPIPTTERLLELKKSILQGTPAVSTSAWDRWGRWFFSDREQR